MSEWTWPAQACHVLAQTIQGQDHPRQPSNCPRAACTEDPIPGPRAVHAANNKQHTCPANTTFHFSEQYYNLLEPPLWQVYAQVDAPHTPPSQVNAWCSSVGKRSSTSPSTVRSQRRPTPSSAMEMPRRSKAPRNSTAFRSAACLAGIAKCTSL